MPNIQFEEIANWANGANTTAAAEMLPPGFSPRARNTALALLGDQTARIGSRRGATTRNATAITGSPGVIGGFQYKKRDGNKYTLLVSDTGRLDKLNTDDTLSVINATAFTSGTHYPIFAVANDLCFIVNDVDLKKFDGTNLRNFGITRPAAPTAAVVAGGAMALGAWDVSLTYYNSATGLESSASDVTTVTTAGANLKINVSWTAPADPQVTHVRVYIRQQAAGPNTYRVTAGATPAPASDGFAVATTATVLDISALQYGAFILLAPSTTENNPPVAGQQFPCFHNQRMFLADSGNIYYSNIKNGTPFPEAFNPLNFEPVSPNDGDTITALVSMWGKLWIFKKFSIHVLDGTDPTSWAISLATPDHGAFTMRSITSADGLLYFWDPVDGPTVYDGVGQPIPFGKQFIQATINYSVLNQGALAGMTAGVCESSESVLFSVPEAGQTRNTLIIPFSYRAKRFHAEWWNPFDVYSIFSVEQSDRLQACYMGNYGGQVFRWWDGTNDGVPSGTASGTVTSAGAATLTDSTATFVTTGAGLKERYVYAISSDGLTVQRRRITANTGTQLTVASNWSQSLNATWTYRVGGIDYQVDSAWLNANAFMKKRYEFLHVQAVTTAQNASLTIDVFTSLDDSAPRRTLTLPLLANGGVYDESLFDEAVYGNPTFTRGRLRLACTGYAVLVRVRSFNAVTLVRLAVQAQTLTLKR